MWKIIIAVVALLILAPIGDTLNRMARSGGTYRPHTPNIRAEVERWRVRFRLWRTPRRRGGEKTTRREHPDT
ncbi:MAG: hypothetical protein IIW86_04095 [Clostridia bacterium]|nr:hypothetical protein [Clostridia bacterium]